MIITLTQEEVDKCRQFAIDSVGTSTSFYATRNQFNTKKIEEDIFIGKIGEFGVWHYYNNLTKFPLSEPDTKIYETGQKNFNADLTCLERHVHVKTQSIDSAFMFGTSWIMQKNDPVLKHPISEDRLAFCLSKGHKVNVLAILPVIRVIDLNLIKQPRLDKFIGNKISIYYEDMKSLPYEELWSM